MVVLRVLQSVISLREFSVSHRNTFRAASRRCAAAAASAPKFAELLPSQQHQIEAFLDTLLDWNTRVNLTAIRDREEAYIRHVDDSLALLPALDACVEATAARRTAGAGVTLIDVGSGAGLPGIILAIARPHWHVTLLDSLQKRCVFTTEAAAAAAAANVSVECARAEDAGQTSALRERHTLVVARAVAELRVLAELCLPLAAVGGHWVAAKGASPQAEVEQGMAAVRQLGGRLVGVEKVDSMAPEGRRTAVIVRKERPTPAKFPRRPGTPKKLPL